MRYITNLFIAFCLTWTACSSGPGSQEKGSEAAQKGKSGRPDGGTGDISAKVLDQKVRSYIGSKTKGKDNYFRMKKDGKPLRLRLIRVHTEYIATLAPNRHFACVDLVDTDGDVYDVDFFIEGTEKNELKITEQTVHKLNGKPFYTWKQRPDNTWHRVPVEKASKKVKGVIQGEDAFRFRYEATIPEIEKEGELWMPIATSDRFQTVKMTSLKTPGDHRMLQEKDHGNKILYVKLKPEHSGKKIKVNYQVKRKEKGPYKDTSADPQNYLASEPLIPTEGRFERISEKVLGRKRNKSDLIKAREIFDHVRDTIAYKKVGKYGTGSAKYACSSGKGNCTEFHSYFISLARAADIPARFSIGAGIPSNRDKGGISGYHCWAEFYADGQWWPVDISEAKKYPSLAVYYFGHHPANRIELSDGRDLQVKPAPDSGPIEFLAYPVLEVGEKRKPVETTFSFTRQQVS